MRVVIALLGSFHEFDVDVLLKSQGDVVFLKTWWHLGFVYSGKKKKEENVIL